METPPPTWELAELEPFTGLQQEFDDILACLENFQPAQPVLVEAAAAAAAPIKFYARYREAVVVDHRNRAGRLEMKVAFDGNPPASAWLDELVESHRPAARRYFRQLATTNKRRWSPLVAKFPLATQLAAEEDQ